jgi:hypothetical protein
MPHNIGPLLQEEWDEEKEPDLFTLTGEVAAPSAPAGEQLPPGEICTLSRGDVSAGSTPLHGIALVGISCFLVCNPSVLTSTFSRVWWDLNGKCHRNGSMQDR